MQALSNRSSERGTVLIYIMIAIMLFGALSVMVSKMMEGDENAKGESTTIQAGEILSFSQTLRAAVRDLMISNGCSDTELSFEKAPFDGSDADYENTNAPSDFSCHVFHPNGGGITPMAAAEDINGGTPWYVSGHSMIHDLGIESSPELIFLYPKISRDLCLKMNDLVGVNGLPVDSDSVMTTTFQGAYVNQTYITYSAVKASLSACYEHDSANPVTYNFYQVLLVR